MTSQSVSDDLEFYNSTANTGPLAFHNRRQEFVAGGSYQHEGDHGFSDEVEDVTHRVGQLENELEEIRTGLKQMQATLKNLIPGLSERSSSSTTVGDRDRQERISNRSGLEPVCEDEKAELINKDYGTDPRCTGRGAQMIFNGMTVVLKWRDRQYRGSNIDMRANEIQRLEKLIGSDGFGKNVVYVRLQLGDEQDLLALVLEILAPPLR